MELVEEKETHKCNNVWSIMQTIPHLHLAKEYKNFLITCICQKRLKWAYVLMKDKRLKLREEELEGSNFPKYFCDKNSDRSPWE